MELRIEVDTSAALGCIAQVRPAVTRALSLAAEDATILTLREMQMYPPQRPPANPRRPYRRTRTLGRSWFRDVIQEGDAVVGRVVSNGNIAPYNVYVQMHTVQAWVHRGHWPTEVQVVERLRPQILRMYEARIGQAIGALR